MVKFVSPATAARILGVHVNTIRTWCLRAEKGLDSKLPNAHRHPANGYFLIPMDDIVDVQSGKYINDCSEL